MGFNLLRAVIPLTQSRPRARTGDTDVMSNAALASPAVAEEPVRPAVPRSAWIRLAACTAAAALLQLDGTLITVALPTVAHGLGVKGSSTSIVLSAYFGA